MSRLAKLQSDLRLTSLVLRGAYYSAYKLRAGEALSPALMMEQNAAATPDADALRFGDRRIHYAQFNAEARGLRRQRSP